MKASVLGIYEVLSTIAQNISCKQLCCVNYIQRKVQHTSGYKLVNPWLQRIPLVVICIYCPLAEPDPHLRVRTKTG